MKRLCKKILSFFKDLLVVTFCAVAAFLGLFYYQTFKYQKPAFDTSQFQAQNFLPIHPVLPLTTWLHIRPCGAYFDEKAEFEKAVSCTNTAFEINDDPYVLSSDLIPLPACYIITIQSGDVYRDGLLNVALFRYGPHVLGAVLGFFNPATQRIFLVENIDLTEIYRHEVQHYLLTLVGIELEKESVHTHVVWDVCEPKTYSRSKRVKDLEALLIPKEKK